MGRDLQEDIDIGLSRTTALAGATHYPPTGGLPRLRQLIAEFRQDAGPLMDELARGVATNDCKAVHRAAHTLKGMVNFFGVSSVAELALHLEKMGASGELTQGHEIFAAFRRELECLQEDLDAI